MVEQRKQLLVVLRLDLYVLRTRTCRQTDWYIVAVQVTHQLLSACKRPENVLTRLICSRIFMWLNAGKSNAEAQPLLYIELLIN